MLPLRGNGRSTALVGSDGWGNGAAKQKRAQIVLQNDGRRGYTQGNAGSMVEASGRRDKETRHQMQSVQIANYLVGTKGYETGRMLSEVWDPIIAVL